MKRRDFLFIFAGATGTVMLSACGSGYRQHVVEGSSQVNGSNNNANQCGVAGEVTYTNPGHTHANVNLTSGQLGAALAGNYTLLGGGHVHTFRLEASDFNIIKNGSPIFKTDLEGHGHVIKISC